MKFLDCITIFALVVSTGISCMTGSNEEMQNLIWEYAGSGSAASWVFWISFILLLLRVAALHEAADEEKRNASTLRDRILDQSSKIDDLEEEQNANAQKLAMALRELEIHTQHAGADRAALVARVAELETLLNFQETMTKSLADVLEQVAAVQQDTSELKTRRTSVLLREAE